jgi:serine phosphatase RsbU (regulator of sigma subunit)
MPSPVPIPSDDEQRVADLKELGMMLTEPEAVYDAVTRELARIFDVPATFITFIDRDTQYYKSEVGLMPSLAETRTEPRELSVCSHVVGLNEMMIVEDLLADERFRENPLVLESGARFYAGAPLRADSGRAVGSLCMVDAKPRTIGRRERDLLHLLAEGLMTQVKLQVASRQLLDRSLQIERELDQAREVQHYLLPPDDIRANGWRIRHLFRPATHLAGDFIEVLERPDGRYAVIVADVAGHGTSAALTAMMAKIAFNRAASSVDSPAGVLTAMNRDLSGMVRPGHFITAFTALLEPGSGEMRIASAGHPYPLLLGDSGVAALPTENELPLLVDPDCDYRHQQPRMLNAGQRMLVFTDGATEAMDGARRMLGSDGLGRLASEASSRSDDFLAALFDGIQTYAPHGMDDDVALLSIEAG